MLPLKIAILWHQHQPYYKVSDEYKLPWVRLHGIKDYLDLLLIAMDYPRIRQTFNIVPSMLMQIDEYIYGSANERILNLTQKKAAELNDTEKEQILSSFFICNFDNMIKPFERFYELFNLAQQKSISLFSQQDWLDLQVWYNLTWTGPVSRQNQQLKYLFAKARDYTEEDKSIMMDCHTQILKSIVPTIKRMHEIGSIEISTSPVFHPILPLICNTDSALESMPWLSLPEPAFQYPEDAMWHLAKAIEYFRSKFDCIPKGLWPSEGSLSDEVINLMSQTPLQWTATDEQILMNSMPQNTNRLERFFPRLYKNSESQLIIFFRDRLLSDLIGFSYSSMDAREAALDFVNRLKYVRWEISSQFGEDSLEHAVVPIILDGENCWEFYPNNGFDFLNQLFLLLSAEEQIKTVTFSEAADVKSIHYREPINKIQAGSWINGNFEIWIDGKSQLKAWSALRDARNLIENCRSNCDPNKIEEAMNTVRIAEGSDWFWWYHHAHQAPNKHDFDIMFRQHLSNVYSSLDLETPEYLLSPFSEFEVHEALQQPQKLLTPELTQIRNQDWQEAGFFNPQSAMGSMHSLSEILDMFYFLADSNYIYLRLEYDDSLDSDMLFKISLEGDLNCTFEIPTDSAEKNNIKISYRIIGNNLLITLPRQNAKILDCRIYIKSPLGSFNYPRAGNINMILPD